MKRPLNLKRPIIGAIAVFSFLIPSVAQADEWRQYQYDAASSGFNPNEVTISPANANRWRVRWSKQQTATRVFKSDPLIDDDSVYVAGKKEGGAAALWSFDLATGHINWVTRLPCERFIPRLIMGDGVIVLTNYECADERYWTYFVDTETGEKNRILDWLGGATPIDADTAVTLRGLSLRTFDLATGTLGPQIGEPVSFDYVDTDQAYPLRVVDGEAWLVGDGFPNPKVVVSDGIAVMPGATKAQGVPLDGSPVTHYGSCPSDRTLSCAVDIETHEVLWTARSDYPIAHEGILYGGCPNLCARKLHTGEVIWSADVLSEERPILAGGVLWVATDVELTGSTIRGYDPETGTLLTRRPFTQHMGPAGGLSMAIANGYLVSSWPTLRVVSFDRR